MVNWVDENGNNVRDGKDEEFKAGMYFSFEIDENNIRDTGEGGYYGGYYWRKFEFGQFGPVWLSAVLELCCFEWSQNKLSRAFWGMRVLELCCFEWSQNVSL